MKFYAIATNKSGKNQMISFDDMGEKAPRYLYQAERDAKLICKKEGLNFQSAHVVQGTQKGNSTLTKFYKLRRKTGSNGKDFAKSL
ncbi:hypothetical protein [Paenibacillus pini]|uniref:Uncharacterized protein n=1 Tax=Paenibacillus pini JCM 16418 TaxID=1236976 RepID=W7YQ88_9BACL|nr:hypothetical protein [Paenibacillus pini]GAF10707.1 hypothetical protein JCM16418_4926 [Paenibacillus pini JCM 16418]